MKDDKKILTVRFPAHLLEQIREGAKQNNRSLNGEILTALEEHVKKQKKGTQAVSNAKRAYHYRFYPTDEQRIILAQTFGCVRFVYNWGLHLRATAYREQGETLFYNDLAARLPDLKKQYPWLGDVSSVPIQQSLRHLDRAFKNFFEGRANYPTFKHENQVICVESLAVKNMVKNHYLAKAISDVGWSEFVRQLEYKSKWYGRMLVKIDLWYPSSKTWHCSKHALDSLPLDRREWDCPHCGVGHDRDINAARNNLTVGLSVAACGGSGRPVRAKARRASPVEAGNAHS